MWPKILIQSLKSQKKSFIFWVVGLVGLIALYMAIYPSVRESAQALNEYIEKMPEAFRAAFIGESDYASPVGYISSEVYTQMLPLLFLFYAIGAGSSAIAGEEEKGTLDILLATPVRRGRVVLEKFGALIGGLLFLSVVVVVSLFIGIKFVDITISLDKLAAVTFNLFLLSLSFGSLALLLGSFTGSKGLAIGLTTATAVLAFFVNALAPIVDFLEKIQKISPFYHYTAGNPIMNGLDWGNVSFFTFIIVVLLGLSIVAFRKRDLMI